MPIIKDVEALVATAIKMPVHHIGTLLDSALAAPGPDSPEDATLAAAQVAKYSDAFAKGMGALSNSQDRQIKPKAAQRRMSAQINHANCTPWMLAQIDLRPSRSRRVGEGSTFVNRCSSHIQNLNAQ